MASNTTEQTDKQALPDTLKRNDYGADKISRMTTNISICWREAIEARLTQ
jgi:hypothetical protein